MGASGFTVRAARDDDLPSVQHVARETWQATYRGHISDDAIRAFLDANYRIDRLRQSLERLGAGFIVVERRSQVIGYATLTRTADGNVELLTIYVLPAYHGQGAGKLLWDAAVEHGRTLGAPALLLWVLEGNARAKRFYERQGAVDADSREFQVGRQTIVEVAYWLQLSPRIESTSGDRSTA